MTFVIQDLQDVTDKFEVSEQELYHFYFGLWHEDDVDENPDLDTVIKGIEGCDYLVTKKREGIEQ